MHVIGMKKDCTLFWSILYQENRASNRTKKGWGRIRNSWSHWRKAWFKYLWRNWLHFELVILVPVGFSGYCWCTCRAWFKQYCLHVSTVTISECSVIIKPVKNLFINVCFSCICECFMYGQFSCNSADHILGKSCVDTSLKLGRSWDF